jgi:hypothetical protein
MYYTIEPINQVKRRRYQSCRSDIPLDVNFGKGASLRLTTIFARDPLLPSLYPPCPPDNHPLQRCGSTPLPPFPTPPDAWGLQDELNVWLTLVVDYVVKRKETQATAAA